MRNSKIWFRYPQRFFRSWKVDHLLPGRLGWYVPGSRWSKCPWPDRDEMIEMA
jgi:hypothetical protein